MTESARPQPVTTHEPGVVNVGVVGTGRWAVRSHIPGWQRDPRCQVVGLADVDADAGQGRRRASSGSRTSPTTTATLVEDPDIDVIDVVTGDAMHFEVTMAALEAGKHVLCEKPVNHDYHEVVRAADLAASKGLKTKLGFTFRYAPADDVRRRADPRGLRRHAVHAQRLRAEQPVARPAEPAAPAERRERPRRHPGRLDRGLRRAGDRHHALVDGHAPDLRRRHHAQLRAGADGPRHRPR